MTSPRSDRSCRSSSAKADHPRHRTWTKDDIRLARRTHLKPVLEQLGYRLTPRHNDNFVVLDLPGEVIIKDHYWRCTDNGEAGNSIDFLVKFRGLSFSLAMQLLRP